MSELLLNHEGLVQDTQATLREVAGILHELWDLQPEGTPGLGGPGFLGSSSSGKDVRISWADAHQEVLALREGIVALRDLLPYAFLEADHRRNRETSLDAVKGRKLTRASEVLEEVYDRVHRLAQELESQSPHAE